MGQVAKLIMVTGANNNKFYNMTEVNGEIQVKYGRVGSTEVSATYPLHRWNSLYKSKVRKGYKDVTELHAIIETIDFQDISNDQISMIVSKLQAFANKSVSTNYTVTSDSVTQAQIDEAQKIIDSLLKLASNKRLAKQKFNDNLLELYQAIPRRMHVVGDHLLGGSLVSNDPLVLLNEEQATLDVMKGQVNLSTAKQQNTQDDKRTILQAMGLDIQLATDEDVRIIKKNLGDIGPHFNKAYRVVNNKCQKRYDEWVEKANNKKTKLFWHGSRNENWWSILDSGLVLRPTNAIITGKMFGMGLYGADKARKSLGYTSYRNSYWANGNSSVALMAMFEFHIGNQYKSKRHEHWMTQLNFEKLRKLGNYDSFYAQGGIDLRNDEFIVYKEDQATIRYLVELK